ncbi:helix-turn-helix domain-containing protein [Kineococcus radiotolerans]|uniref:DNA binding domain, excisionase family n=1 Tax=Kineococcus radiotolerans (strain ATCC BAA-149 / DSM 14245 / SRS30216) TaxID=266940 RepID=A6W8X4_KINRD|nr:helix-turn-helix domain-containing protein [Kineococcus radiotolerans]ABS03263.1 DNA binding domain, excisionase family [Kineococcus radiotolerans SRS30216 = ATCC BAA-149]
MTALDLYTLAQVAVIFGRSQRWVRDRVRAGDLSHVRVGSSIRFTEQQLRDYIERNSRTVSKPAAVVNGYGRRTRTR